MKKTVFLMIAMMIVSAMSLSAKKQSTTTPEGYRVVLKAVADFNTVTVNAPVTVEFIKDAQHAGYIVYHTTVKNELKVYNKGANLIIDTTEKNVKELHVTSRVVICYDDDINNVIVNGSGTALARELTAAGDMNCVVNGSGDIRIGDLTVGNTFTGTVNGSGDFDVKKLKAATVVTSVNGSGDFKAEDVTASKNVALTVNGAGDLDIKNVKTDDFAGSVIGSGDLDVKGTTVNASLSLNGSGDLKAGSLKADNVVVNAARSGDVHCRASKSLRIKASGSCDVHVHGGRPAHVEGVNDNVHISGE